MPYSMMIGAKTRGCILMLVDQSGSMVSPCSDDPRTTLAEVTARAVNSILEDLSMLCTSGDKIKDRFDVGVIGYGASVRSLLPSGLPSDRPASICDVAAAPRVETVKRKVHDGTGRLIEIDDEVPVWIEPQSHGRTPMAEAFDLAGDWTRAWCLRHRRSFPPVVVNITDAEPSDINGARKAAARLTSVATDDGALLLFSAHVSAKHAISTITPHDPAALPDEHARFLYEISSPIPDPLLGPATEAGLPAVPGARGFVSNANAMHMISLLRFGTIGTMTAMSGGPEA